MRTIDARTIDGGGSVITVDDEGRITGEVLRSDLPPEWVEIEIWGSDYVTRTDNNHGTIQHKIRDAEEWIDGPIPH
jgi:hypothetical protein